MPRTAAIFASLLLALTLLATDGYSACPTSQPGMKCHPAYFMGLTTGTPCDKPCAANQTCPNEDVATCVVMMDGYCSGPAPTTCQMSQNPTDVPNQMGKCTRSSNCPLPQTEDKCVWFFYDTLCGTSHVCYCSDL